MAQAGTRRGQASTLTESKGQADTNIKLGRFQALEYTAV